MIAPHTAQLLPPPFRLGMTSGEKTAGQAAKKGFGGWEVPESVQTVC